MGKYILLVLWILVSTQFFCLSKAKAADADIVISEVMANAPAPETDLEWVEIYNNGSSEVDLNGWTFEGKIIDDAKAILAPNDYLIFARDKAAFSLKWPAVSVTIVETTFVLTNASDTITLENTDKSYSKTFTWVSDAGENLSWERDAPTSSDWHICAINGGTPGEKNFVVIIEPPVEYPEEILELINIDSAIIQEVQVVSITDGDTIKVTGLEEPFSSTVRLLYADTPEKDLPFFNEAKIFTEQLLGQTIDLLISENSSEQVDLYGRTLAVVIYQDKVFNTELLAQGLASFYDYDNSIINNDAWLAILKQAQEARIGLWEASSLITLSELLPNPDGEDATGEWVEIYNPNGQAIDLSRFILEQYLIPSGTVVSPYSYLVFYRNVTEITLNNAGDTVRLFFPGGLMFNEVDYGQSSEDLAWAMDMDGRWEWTESLTPGAANDIYLSPEEEEEDGMGGTDEEIVINSVPIEIQTGEFRDFNQKLIAVSGTIITTSGNTFFLDDGSGQAKIYIQEKTGIAKPPMHKGDIFEIIGIVNLYRNTWRILPQKQSDVKLVKCMKDEQENIEASSEETSKTMTKSSTANKSTAQARAPTVEPIVKQVKAAEAISADISAETKSTKPSWWLQIIKAIVGLAVIFLIILIIKIKKFPKVKVIGGHFGEDET